MLQYSISYFFALIILWGSPLLSKTADELLKPYQNFLREGTYNHEDFSALPRLPLSRFETFTAAFELLKKENPLIVELGTSRSFNHGGLLGCNQNDPKFWHPESPETWDWGAGFFTRMAALFLTDLGSGSFHTVDLAKDHIYRCKIMTKEFKDLISYHISSSEEFLKKFPQQIDLLYLDTGDMTPIEPTALLQLREAKIIVERDLIAPGGLILIDDVKNQTPKRFGEISDLGKAKYSLPFLLEHGFEIIMDEYQVLLRKSL